MTDRINGIKQTFEKAYGASCEIISCGPGRVDLLGIHTDYNDGFVLPVAIDYSVLAAGKKRSDNKIRLYSENFDSSSEFDLDDITYDDKEAWSNYVRGVFKFVCESGARLSGVDIALSGNVPLGGGLSSSAAIEMATATLLQGLFGFEMTAEEMALTGQKAENSFVGVSTGIMDQFASRLGKKDHALFLDCRTQEYDHLPLDTSKVKIVVCNTMKQRGLVDSEYDLRRSQCEEAVRIIAGHYPDVRALRDVNMDMIERHADELPRDIKKRAVHVVSENMRLLKSKSVLEGGDFEAFAGLMNASHDSARDYYEVSCDELEAMVEVTRNAPGSLCGRLAGAGFGGCTVSLVEADRVEDFIAHTKSEYSEKTAKHPEIYVCKAEDGAKIIENSK